MFKMNIKKFISYKCFLAFFAFIFVCVSVPFLSVQADEGTVLLETRVWDQSVVLYTRNTGSAGAQARIASENIADITVDGQDGTLPITTWLLLDNSVSIKRADQSRAKELLIDLVSARSSNEAFTLCTFSDRLNPILWESQDYSELKQAIEGIQHYDQETYLTDCLDELLALETARSDARYVRVIVISDGVDNNPGGITRDELEKKLEKNNFPVYSIGCDGNAQELKEMYAISRQTGAKYWAFGEAQNYDVTHTMSNEEIPARITIPIPETLCDGTTKGVQVTFDNGTVLQTQVDMPFGAIISSPAPTVEPTAAPTPAPTPTPVPTPPPVEEEEEEYTAADWMREHWLLIVIIALVIIALAVGGYIFLQRRKPGENTVSEEAGNASAQDGKGAPPHGSIFIGRVKEGNDIMIDNPLISKSHCAIAVSGDVITVYDLDSLNGTLVDGMKLEKGGHREARSGSTLTLANAEFEMEIRYIAPDFPSYDGGDTVFMNPTVFTNPEDAGNDFSDKRILRLTDRRRRDLCYEAVLPDSAAGIARASGTVYMEK